MLRPLILSGIKEGNGGLGFGINAVCEVISVTITAMTGKGKIRFGIGATQGLRDEVAPMVKSEALASSEE